MVKGTCPYCGLYQDLSYPNMEEKDYASFFTVMEEPVITDSFNEIEMKTLCQKCKKEFHFILNVR